MGAGSEGGDGRGLVCAGYCDPIASSLATDAQHAVAVGLLKPVNLAGLYDLGPLNTLLKAAGEPQVSR